MDEHQMQGPKPSAGTAGQAADTEAGRPTFWKRAPVMVAIAAVLAVLLFKRVRPGAKVPAMH